MRLLWIGAALLFCSGSPAYSGPLGLPQTGTLGTGVFNPAVARHGGWLPLLGRFACWSQGPAGQRALPFAALWGGLPPSIDEEDLETLAVLSPLVGALSKSPEAEDLRAGLSRVSELSQVELNRLMLGLEAARRQAAADTAKALSGSVSAEIKADSPDQEPSLEALAGRLKALQALEGLALRLKSCGLYADEPRIAQSHRSISLHRAGMSRQAALLAAQETAAKASLSQGPTVRAFSFGALVYASPAMEAALRRIGKFAQTAAPVLLEGESGTGKELVAQAIHELSPRRQGPFVTVNVGAIPDELIESELFGHAKGAFTGAVTAREGRAAAAQGGTLFLDEIEAATPKLQIKLLRFLENGEIQPVGENASKRVDARVITASNQDLKALARSGRFREDLYFRLRVLPIRLPPLRDRPQDILPLAEHFLALGRAGVNSQAVEFSRLARDLLLAHLWPGNVRELQHAVERAMVLAEGSEIEPQDLELEGFGPGIPASPPLPSLDSSAGALRPMAEVEREHILRVFEACGRVALRTATVLGLSYRTVRERLRRYGVFPAGRQ